jgi:hypothetical protein
MINKRKRWIKLPARLSQFFRWWKKPVDPLIPIDRDKEEVTHYRREKNVFYNGETYADFPGTLFHDFRVWQIVTASLPDDYVLPNPESVRILLPMTADFYRSIFSSPAVHPDLMVDDQIWKRIKTALPPHYKIPKTVEEELPI